MLNRRNGWSQFLISYKIGKRLESCLPIVPLHQIGESQSGPVRFLSFVDMLCLLYSLVYPLYSE